MAKDLTPDAWIASWSVSGSNIVIPIASITGLTSGDCDVTTGDIRRVLECLMDTLIAHQATLSGGNVITTMTLAKSSANQTVLNYNLQILASPTAFTIATEPP